VPGLDAGVRKLIELQYERALRQVHLASSVKVGPRQLPEVWEAYERALTTLDLPETYDLYVTQWPVSNAAAIGAGKPMILLASELVRTLEPDELQSVLGHELGHVLGEHVLYQTALIILLQVGGRLPLVAGLPLRAMEAALLEWFRAAELSADRAAALACRDPLATCRSLMVLASGIESKQLDLDAFVQQAATYEEWDSGWDKLLRFLVERRGTHPFAVRRVAELTSWVREGEYDRILGGHYRRRGEEDARADAGAAYDHYVNRFWRIFREAGEGADAAKTRLGDWLRGGGADE
jgi:Zn-dependent protease with chaperone function